MAKPPPYEQRRNPNLPWGYWLSAPGETTSDKVLLDEDGSTWETVRECLWVKRLNMPMPESLRGIDVELEFLLAYLVIKERRIVPVEEEAIDLFGSYDRARFYECWLIEKGLLTYYRGGYQHPKLTCEAVAILVMLGNTRSTTNRLLPIGLPTVEWWHGLDPAANTPERQEAINKLERFAEQLPFRFERVTIGKVPAIRLVGDGLGPNIPLRRTLWSLTFPDQYARDRFYCWLQHRVDRWTAWGERAFQDGARAFSEYLLQMQLMDQTFTVDDQPKG